MQNEERSKASAQKQLFLYSTAAGLGAFAVGQVADGAVIYTDVPDVSVSPGGATLYINLDGLGQNEFTVVGVSFNTSIRVNSYNAGGQNSQVLTTFGNGYYVQSFAPGSEIGPSSTPETGANTAAGGPYQKNFVGTGNYIGLKWDIGGGDFAFGWAAVDVTGTGSSLQATLKSFAYEDTPNAPIIAGAGVPEPGSLALLAAGAGALAFRRRQPA